MITDEKAEKYMRKLRKYCGGRECDECMFYNMEKDGCSLVAIPQDWELPNET